MWVLGNSKGYTESQKFMLQNIANEFNTKSNLEKRPT